MRIINIIKGGMKYIFDSDYRFLYNCVSNKYTDMNDEEYVKRLYKARVGKTLNLDNPKRFTEKLNWLKLYYHKDIFTKMVDKYDAKEIVKVLIGDEHVIPTLGIYDSPDDIKFDELPNKFVLKCTHDSGSIIICRDRSRFDIEKVKEVLRKGLKQNLYNQKREWVYKNVKPRILAEEYVQDGECENLNVYKVFNFSGNPYIIQVIQNDKTPQETIDYYDTQWNRLDLRQNFPNSDILLSKPETLDEMLEYSAKCSVGHPFLRTDWYEVNGRVLFSEFTFYSDAGFEGFEPDWWDDELGKMIVLPDKKVL